MAKQQGDTKTLDIPGLPPAPRKRGRPLDGDVPMSPAERMRNFRQRAATKAASATSFYQSKPARTPVPFSTSLDSPLLLRLKQDAKNQGVTISAALESILEHHYYG